MSLSNPQKNLKIFLDYIKNNLPLEKWGFSNFSEVPNGYIFDSKTCRVKFELSLFNYYPLHETIIYYGRLHAPDNENHINWNGEKCLCWHKNIWVAIPFIEGVSAQQLANDSQGETWQYFVNILKVDYPHTDYLEYPLRLHAKIWEHYGGKLFSIFDLSNLEVWEEFSKYSAVYTENVNRELNVTRDVEMIC